MEDVIRKARVLIEALPFIQAFRGATVVVKFGGSAMEDESIMHSVLCDVAFMECVGMRPVVVHGGGKAISRSMNEHGIASRFVRGLRVTCEKTMEVVEKVMKGEINPKIVAMLQNMGAKAETVDGKQIFLVRKKTDRDEKSGEVIDWGLVGEPGDVHTEPIMRCLNESTIPVIMPLGLDVDGQTHNINADTAACAVAQALGARKLVFLSDVPGLLRQGDDPETLISTLRVGEVETLMEAGVIGGGMMPKVTSGVAALRAGVKKVHMIDGRMPHSLLLEMFTDRGVGTEIVKD